jgi:hypothetical protein
MGIVDHGAVAEAGSRQEAKVEAKDVLPHDGVVGDELLQPWRYGIHGGCLCHLLGGDAGEHLYAVGDRPAGIHQGGEGLLNDALWVELDRPHLDDGVTARLEAGCLQVEGYVGAGQEGSLLRLKGLAPYCSTRWAG